MKMTRKILEKYFRKDVLAFLDGRVNDMEYHEDKHVMPSYILDTDYGDLKKVLPYYCKYVSKFGRKLLIPREITGDGDGHYMLFAEVIIPNRGCRPPELEKKYKECLEKNIECYNLAGRRIERYYD